MRRPRQTNNRNRLFLHLEDKAKVVPVDANQWSEDSKRSYVFHSPPASYEDIKYHCSRCGKSAVYSAAEQKLAIEVRKAYIWQRRTLCPECWSARQRIERGIRECQSRWRTHKRELQRDAGFLRQWLGLLETHPDYGGRKNHSGVTMLRRLLGASV